MIYSWPGSPMCFGFLLFLWCLRRLTFFVHPKKVSKEMCHCVKLYFVQCFYEGRPPSPARAVPPPTTSCSTRPSTHTAHPHQRHNGPCHLWVILKSGVFFTFKITARILQDILQNPCTMQHLCKGLLHQLHFLYGVE